MCRDRVLDGEVVQVEFPGERENLIPAEPVEAYPGHSAVRVSQLGVGLIQCGQRADSFTVEIDRIVDHPAVGSGLGRRRSVGGPALVPGRVCGAESEDQAEKTSLSLLGYRA